MLPRPVEFCRASGVQCAVKAERFPLRRGQNWQCRSEECMRAMRSSVFLPGASCGAYRKSVDLHPGGCRLGARPIDLHLKGLADMGAQIRQAGNALEVTAPNGLRGAQISLRFPSVGATETLLMAAVCARVKPCCAAWRWNRKCGISFGFCKAQGRASPVRGRARFISWAGIFSVARSSVRVRTGLRRRRCFVR